MRKLVSAALCAVLALGSAVSVSAAVQTPDNASESSYKEEFINALLKSEDKWLDSTVDRFMFVDMDLDGKPELVAQDWIPTSQYCIARAYYYDNNVSLVNVENVQADYFSSRDLTLYYDTELKKYRMFGVIYGRDDMDDEGYYNFKYLNLEFESSKEHSISYDSYSAYSYKNNPADSEQKKNVQYYGDSSVESFGEVITESEYDSINKQKLENCVNANMSFDFLLKEEYNNLSDSQKKVALETIYDSFTYDKYDESDSDNPSPDDNNDNNDDNNNNSTTVTTADFDKYVKDVLSAEYGYANTEDMTRTISSEDLSDGFKSIQGWSKRSGILGYDVLDMNSDGKDEMILYWFDGSEENNTLNVDFYTANDDGEISLKNTYTLYQELEIADNYCVGEIAEVNGNKYLCVESFKDSRRFTNGGFTDYQIFECNDNNELVLKYNIKKSHSGTSGYEFWLLTLNDNGEYDKEVIWTFDDDNKVSMEDAIQSAFESIGFPATDKTTGDVLESLGYVNYKLSDDAKSVVEKYPSYFGTEIAEKSFHMVNTAVDGTIYNSMEHKYVFKSTVKFYENNVPTTPVNTDNTNNNTTTNANNNTTNNANVSNNNSVTSPKTGSRFSSLPVLSIMLVSVATAFIALRKRKANS